MKFNVETKGFQETVKNLSRFAGAKSPIMMLNNLRLRAEGESVLIEACDGTAWAGTTLVADVETAGEFLLDAAALARFAGSCESELINLSIDEKLKGVMKSGKEKFTLPALPSEDWPTLKETEWEMREVALDVVRSAVNFCLPAVSTDTHRPILTAIYFNAADKKVVSTDAHRCHVCDLALNLDKDLSLSPLTAQWLLSVPDGGTIEIGRQDSLVRFADGKSYYVGTEVYGTYPNYQRVLAPSDIPCLVVDRRDLLAAARNAYLLGDIRVALIPQGDVLTVASRNQAGQAFKTEIPVTGSALHFAVNAKYLTAALQALTADKVRIFAKETHRPFCILEEDSEAHHITLMPLAWEEIEEAA